MMGVSSVITAWIGTERGATLLSWEVSTRVASWIPSPSGPSRPVTIRVAGAEIPSRARDNHPSAPPSGYWTAAEIPPSDPPPPLVIRRGTGSGSAPPRALRKRIDGSLTTNFGPGSTDTVPEPRVPERVAQTVACPGARAVPFPDPSMEKTVGSSEDHVTAPSGRVFPNSSITRAVRF